MVALLPLLRSICSTTRRSYSSYRSTNPLKSSLLHRIPLIHQFSTDLDSTAAPGTSVGPSRLCNIAVIGHLHHGKTMLIDSLLRQCGPVTISSKGISIPWGEHELNMIDTPGHTDFGDEVERVISMVEGAILVVDASEGPLAQTKFVLEKALKYGLHPLLLLNKVDKPSVTEERCDEVENLVFRLFANLGATDEQLYFPILYASAKEGWVSSTFTKYPLENSKNMATLLDVVVNIVSSPATAVEALQYSPINPSVFLAMRSSRLRIPIGDARRGGIADMRIFKDPPPSVDWSKLGAVTHAKFQGDTGACWAFAAVGAIEGLIFIKTNKLVNLSVQHLLDCVPPDRGLWNYRSGGTSGSAFLHTAEHGVSCEEGDSTDFKICGYHSVPPFDEDSILRVVAQQPIVVSIYAGGPLFRDYKGGIFMLDYDADHDSGDDSDPDHTVLLVGYGVEGGVKYWKFKNSWGEDWGEKGFMRMRRDCIFDDGFRGITTDAYFPI